METGWNSRFIELNGLRFHYVEAGSEEGELVILLHGFPEFWWAWRKQIDVIGAAGFRVVVPDMRGYGQSAGTRAIDTYRLDHLVGDVAALADLLGYERFNLVGHDWGGIVVWATASTHPGRVMRSIIINAPHLDTMATVVRRHPSQLVRGAYVGFFQLPLLPEAVLSACNFALLRRSLTASSKPNSFSPQDLDAYSNEWSRPGRLRSMLNYYRALVRRPHQPLGRIEPPTLILWGCRDHALLPQLAEASVLQCASGRLEFHPNATHWVHIEEPEWVNEKIVAYLEKHQPKAR